MDKLVNNNKTTSKYEVLAPAGSYECMIAAFNAGADAVYVGGQFFGARAFANNFDQDELIEAINYAHLHNKKLFLTVNTLLKNQEVKNKLVEYLVPLYEVGLDAVIVQDFGVLSLVKEHFPDMDIHASTQMTVTGPHFAKELKELGVSRIVPARELSLNEIEDIYKSTGLEIECFVHGALCYSYSGLCLLSSLIGARSGNRGRCAQPCRLPYDVLLSDKSQKEQYPLSPKDLCTLKLLPKILNAGVYSLKIEGRMKKPEYVASVTAMYRKYVDIFLEKGEAGYKVSEEDIKILMDIYNRGSFTEGYYQKHNGRELMTIERPNHMGLKVASVIDVDTKRSQIIAKALENISKDDVLEIFLAKGNSIYIKPESVQKNREFRINFNNLYFSNNERIDYKKISNIINKSTSIMRTRNNSLIKDIQEKYITKNSKFSHDEMLFGGNVVISKNCPITVDLWIDDNYVHIEGATPDLASNRPICSDDILKQFNKTGGTGFVLDKDNFNITLEDGLFVNIKDLNQLRREALEQLGTMILEKYKRKYNHTTKGNKQSLSENNIDDSMISVLVSSIDQLKEVLTNEKVDIIYAEINLLDNKSEWDEYIFAAHNNNKKILFALPYITRTAAKKFLQNIKALLESLDFDGFLYRNMESVCLINEMNIKREYSVFDNTIYGMNDYSIDFLKTYKPNMLTASYELNKSELMHINNSQMELCVYGYIPVMISAGCIKKTYNQCDKKPESIKVKDRLGNIFINKNCCQFCYNILYNSTPLYLYDLSSELMALSPKALRFNFVNESAVEVRDILNGVNVKNYTRGHYKRGVE